MQILSTNISANNLNPYMKELNFLSETGVIQPLLLIYFLSIARQALPSTVRQIVWQEHDMFYQDLPAKASPHNILNCFQTTIPKRGERGWCSNLPHWWLFLLHIY